jgi:hypothetical protein
MRLMKLIAVFVAAAVASLSLAVSAEAAAGMQVGVEDDWAFTSGAGNANRAIRATQELHADVVRVFVMWADVGHANPYSRRAPRRPHYSFRGYEGLVTRALQRHIEVQMVLTGPAPAWATADHRKGTFAPRSPYFGEFARQAALWFRGRVHRFSIWNEPNYVSWLSPQSQAPGIYRALYTAAYSKIKRVDPTDQVLLGETSPYAERRRAIAPLAFLRGVLCNGHCGLLRTDGYAHHPYDFYHSPYYRYPGGDNVTIATLSRLSSALRYWALRGKLRDPRGHIPEIYLSEFGYLSSGGARIDDSRHARYLQIAFGIALRTPHVRELVQYTLVPPRGRYRFFDMSILTSRWTHRRPFDALASWARAMQKRRLILTP